LHDLELKADLGSTSEHSDRRNGKTYFLRVRHFRDASVLEKRNRNPADQEGDAIRILHFFLQFSNVGGD
jgi:hypothetical protein